MDMVYRQVVDDTHTSLYVNKGGKLEQYNPGTMYIYAEDASDYSVMVELAEKALKEYGFVMRNADDAQKTISWGYEFDSECSKERCDAVIASISKAMPSVRLTCYSINEKVARIREAFVTRFDERLAVNYIIQGERGEAKRIPLHREFVKWQ